MCRATAGRPGAAAAYGPTYAVGRLGYLHLRPPVVDVLALRLGERAGPVRAAHGQHCVVEADGFAIVQLRRVLGHVGDSRLRAEDTM